MFTSTDFLRMMVTAVNYVKQSHEIPANHHIVQTRFAVNWHCPPSSCHPKEREPLETGWQSIWEVSSFNKIREMQSKKNTRHISLLEVPIL